MPFPTRNDFALRFAAIVALACMGWSAATAKDLSKTELKALFVARIVQFVEWPDGSFSGAGDPIRIVTLDDDDFASALDDLLGAQEIHGRSVVVESVPEIESASDVHVAIVTKRIRSAHRRTIRTLENRPVVTIGPSFEFAESGGVVGMELHRGKVAFDVNLAAARDVGLNISSRVLKLATTVY